ncbi:hypothetical protein P8C59_001486 [Phyllachora maydis]|uniref:Adenylyl cyclase-associated protein n=1 Tax=Phyllachora maydis TaxID=1825666 RepID=A0AAD9HZU6_9PEZI|nr:hypothetical protein P8C59_001486 [Phyllachora maydis]
MTGNNMHNLTTLIKRLEAATARLEDIASSTIELPQAVPALQNTLASPASATSSVSTPQALSTPAPAPGPRPAPAPAPAPAAPPEPIPESVEDFDAFLSGAVKTYATKSNALGGLVAEQAAHVVRGFTEQRRFLLVATKCKKPDLAGPETSVFQDLLKPINNALVAVTEIKESNRGCPVFSQLSTVAEGIMVLAWITVDTRPYKHIEECLGSAQFFGNRVLKEFKDKDAQQVEWVQSFYQVFRDLTEHVKNNCPNGPWNPTGKSLQDVVKTMSAVPPLPAPPVVTGAGAPPAPPPPPPPPPGPPPVIKIKEQQKAEPVPSGGFGAVFSELNQGESVTKSLRKVDRSEMTHKNPSLRSDATVPSRDGSVRAKSPAPGKKPKPESMRVKKPAKKELEGNKWTVENFEKEPAPIEIEASIAHSVLISKCSGTTIIIKGKANAVTVENTSRLSLVVDSLVSTVDAVKSTNFALQVLGTIPTVMLDQIDGAQIYFSKESSATKIFSSKSAGINLNVIAGPDEDYKEVPLPSQLCSYYDEQKGDLVNEIVSHAG